jgi:hypothetical protein
MTVRGFNAGPGACAQLSEEKQKTEQQREVSKTIQRFMGASTRALE